VIGARRAIIAVLVAGGSAFGAASALGVTETISSSPQCCTYSKPTFTIDAGQVANFSNPDSASHNVTATVKGPDGEDLFASPTVGQAGQTQVNGTQYLAPGSYAFFCTVHPDMTATLAVAGGTPVPRPQIAIKVLSKKIDKVVSSGTLKVKVSAPSESDDVVLEAVKGSRKIGSKKNIDLAAGSSQNIKLHLTSTGKQALNGLGSAKVKVTGEMPFGSPATAKRKLR
jgi:plastocyanin